MSDLPKNPDYLKSAEELCAPDPRSHLVGRIESSGFRKTTIDDHHRDVAQFELSLVVPEGIRIHFETAKNLYLYAWLVYRFYPVAEHHALASLELGLRERFKLGIPKKYWSIAGREPTLKPLLRYAIDINMIRNQGFRRWNERVLERAKHRYDQECLSELIERNLDQIELDYNQVAPNDEDREWDYLPILLEVLPEIRNGYAHGSTMLHNQVLGTLELVCEILNQLFDGDTCSDL